MNSTETDQRLKLIFSTILELPADSIDDTLTPQTCAKWDSLNQIHLINGIEEEFGLQMEFEDQMRLLSFAIAREIVAAASATT